MPRVASHLNSIPDSTLVLNIEFMFQLLSLSMFKSCFSHVLFTCFSIFRHVHFCMASSSIIRTWLVHGLNMDWTWLEHHPCSCMFCHIQGSVMYVLSRYISSCSVMKGTQIHCNRIWMEHEWNMNGHVWEQLLVSSYCTQPHQLEQIWQAVRPSSMDLLQIKPSDRYHTLVLYRLWQQKIALDCRLSLVPAPSCSLCAMTLCLRACVDCQWTSSSHNVTWAASGNKMNVFCKAPISELLMIVVIKTENHSSYSSK